MHSIADRRYKANAAARLEHRVPRCLKDTQQLRSRERCSSTSNQRPTSRLVSRHSARGRPPVIHLEHVSSVFMLSQHAEPAAESRCGSLHNAHAAAHMRRKLGPQWFRSGMSSQHAAPDTASHPPPRPLELMRPSP